METKRDFNERESLELISSMIQQTKVSLQVGRGNVFLLYGYTALAIGVVVYVCMFLELHLALQSLWFLMVVPMIVVMVRG